MSNYIYQISDELKHLIGGANDEHYQMLETKFKIQILTRNSGLELKSERQDDLIQVLEILDSIKYSAVRGTEINKFFMTNLLGSTQDTSMPFDKSKVEIILRNRNGQAVQAKTENQVKMVDAVYKNDVVFVRGPAGTGKTFLAVALACAALESGQVDKISLVRPAVEAGENLGFLPGDLEEKIAPYLRPLYDSLSELLPKEKLQAYQEGSQIEIAPLAYMRGRTLKRSFIILDEAQNTTKSQMKMFLTRLGPKSKVIITGDRTQVDLPHHQSSGFDHAMRILDKVKGISQVNLDHNDVLRHHLVKKIIQRYEESVENNEG